jgi:hypothetical protein
VYRRAAESTRSTPHVYILQPDGTRLYHDIARSKDEEAQ